MLWVPCSSHSFEHPARGTSALPRRARIKVKVVCHVLVKLMTKDKSILYMHLLSNLACRQVDALRLDVGQVYPLFNKNQEARLGEHQLRRRGVDKEFANEGTLGVPYVNSFPTPRIHVAIRVKLDAVGNSRVAVGENTTVCERLTHWINIILVAVIEVSIV